MEPYFYATEDSITLYWELPEDSGVYEGYRILVDGREAGITNRTHYELTGLEAERNYEISLYRIPKTFKENDGSKARGNAVEEAEQECPWKRVSITTTPHRRRLNVTQSPYRAAGDGHTMNTLVLQQAIDDCGPGETVYLPAGVYRTGALRLHSDMELYLEEGAVLLGTDNPEDYLPRIWSRFEGTELPCYQSLLNLGELDHDAGYNCKNVVIRGGGTIESGGRTLAERVIADETVRLKDYLEELGDMIQECEKPETIPGRVRPRLINMSNCQNITLSHVTLKNGASWNVHMIYSDHIVTDHCIFYSENIWNGDGWDPDSSTDCTVFGCTFYTGDDSVAIKSGKNPEGNTVNRPSARIRVFDCQCAFGHGICIGSEMSGGVEDVSIWDCDMGNSLCGIEIKGTKKRGGYVRGVKVVNVRSARVLFHSVGYNDDGVAAKEPPVFENCRFENLEILGEYYSRHRGYQECEAIELCGFDMSGHELRNIIFRNITIGKEGQSRKQTISLQFCEDITLERVRCL